MKILLLASETHSMFWYRKDMMCEFVRQGCEVVAASEAPEKDWTDVFGSINVKYRQIYVAKNGINPFDDIKTLRDIVRLIEQEKPDKIFAYHAKTVVYGSLAAKKCGVDGMYALIAGLGSVLRGNGFKNSIIRLVLKTEYKAAFKCCKSVITHNSEDRQLLIDEHFAKPDKIKTVNGSGVNLERFRYSKPPENNVFLFIARLIGDKGIREYIAAAHKVKEKYPQATFRIVGPYDTNPSALNKREMQTYIDSGDIEYLGELNDVCPQLDDCMVFVLPSYHEGTPKTVLEAMATGRPVITTDVPGCRAAVSDGYNGYLVPAKDSDSLSEKMIYLIEHYDEAVALGLNGRKLAEDKYDSVKVNRSILDIMEIPYKKEVLV